MTSKGYKQSEEHKEKIRAALTGKRLGKPLTEKQIAANTARRGRPRSDETKAKLSVINKQRRLSFETRIKISIAQRERYENDPDERARRKTQLSPLDFRLPPEERDRRIKNLVKRQSETRKETALEALARETLTYIGVEFEAQAVIDRMIVDFLIPESKRVIEVDGLYWHLIPEQEARDRRREFILEKLGYTVRRITDDKLYADPVAAIRAAVFS